jgi:hypothetical protein
MEIDSELQAFWTNFNWIVNDIPEFMPYFFRGESGIYELRPSIARPEYLKNKNGFAFKVHENRALESFKEIAVAYLDGKVKPRNILEWAVLAQHYGMPTRLLDWTTNPMVALFFAVEKNDQEDGRFYYLEGVSSIGNLEDINFYTSRFKAEVEEKWNKDEEMCGYDSIEHYGSLLFIRPSYEDKRYLNQKTILALPSNPLEIVNIGGLSNLHIPSHLKPHIRKNLRNLGMTHSFIYPSLDGVAKEMTQLLREYA